MGNLSVDLRLRPIRFAFLVRPNDSGRLLKIFQVNTCLWGGKFNPIIPYFKQVPKWWNREGRRFENNRQIINGYLDFFEPDFVVEAEDGLAKELKFHPERVLKLKDILVHDGEREKDGFGLSVNGIYADLYKKEFQFTRRRKQNVVYVKPQDPSFNNVSACLFGAFPSAKGLKRFEKNYIGVFDPKKVDFTPEFLAKVYKSFYLTPLRISQHFLDIDYQDNRPDPTLFIFKASEPRDLIDFWNLRAIHRDIWPIPMEWLAELSSVCKEFITNQHRPLPGNPNGVMIQPSVMFSRSIPEGEIKQSYERYLKVEKKDANCIQTSYPSIWRTDPEFVARTTRPILKATTKTVDTVVDLDKPIVNFETLWPEFAHRYGNRYRFANVVEIGGWGHKDQVATVFPCEYRDPIFPDFCLGGEHLIPTTEGLVFFPRYKDISERWELHHGNKAINIWLNKKKIKAVHSEAGRATQQIIQTLEGFWGVGRLASADIVKLLDDMSKKQSRSVSSAEFYQRINTAVSGRIWKYKELETLVERKAVELGLGLKCSKCGNRGWYPLSGLDYSITCELCLQKFGFPITNPTAKETCEWAYRVIGPFALPHFARGGYASALAIRFFSDVVGKMDKVDVTWSAGQELEFSAEEKVESDFILWYQRKTLLGLDYPTQIVFGETKSFGREVFTDDDIKKAFLLAKKFPGAILVFATMKEVSDFSKEEIIRIRKFAEWGRGYDKEREQIRAPVIVLTGTELFAPHSLAEAWKEKGGKHSEILPRGYVRLDNLEILANLTQQLYLNMPSYEKWHEELYSKRWARRKQR